MSDKTSSGCLKPILIGVVTLLVLVILFVLIALPSVVTNLANKQLPGQLGTEGELSKTTLQVFSGKAGIQDLVLEQPEGFGNGEGPLLTLERLQVHAPILAAVQQDPVLVQSFDVSGVHLHLIRDTNSVLNVSTLGPVDPPEEEEPEEPAAVPPVWVKNMLAENIQVVFEDLAKEWKFEVTDIKLELQDLQVVNSQVDGPGLIRGQLHLPGGKATGSLALHAKVGVISPDKPEEIPSLQLALGLTGFDLDLVAPFLAPSPSAVKTALGGGGVDFTLFVQISPPLENADQQIKGAYLLNTNRGNTLGGTLGGTVAQPQLPFMDLFNNLLGFQLGRALNMGTNVAQGGLQAGKAVADTGLTAVKGVGNTVGGLAGGLFRTAKGVATLDKDEALGGLSDSTVGTVKNAAGTVTDTAGTAGSGLADTAGTATGADDADSWWETIEERQEAFNKQVETWFEENPFPYSGTEKPAASKNETESD